MRGGGLLWGVRSGDVGTGEQTEIAQARIRSGGAPGPGGMRVWQTEPSRLLRKCRHTPAQSGLRDAAQRRDNVLAAYEAADPAGIAGHRILLIDDICTTGATLRECARVLREAGAADVMCAVAREPRRKSMEKLEKVHKMWLQSRNFAAIISHV